MSSINSADAQMGDETAVVFQVAVEALEAVISALRVPCGIHDILYIIA